MAADGSNMIYNLSILHKVTFLPFMNARMLRMASPYIVKHIVKHVHVIRIFNYLKGYCTVFQHALKSL